MSALKTTNILIYEVMTRSEIKLSKKVKEKKNL